jgi:hypothetical protein
MRTAVIAAPAIKKSPLRMLAAACMLAVGVCILSFAMSGADAANSDYICYWAAGQQLVHGANPYDGAAVLRIERAYGFQGSHAAFMRNPPSALFMSLPLGFLGERAGAIVWTWAVLGALMVSIRLIWIMHGRPADRLHLVGYCFPPAMACLFGSQMGTFLLLGVTLFLYFRDRKPYFAGAALLLCMMKPHLFLPFGIVLLAWILTRRAYRILAGAVLALGASLALSFLLDPHGWSHYAAMINGETLQDQLIPTLSLMFRLVIDRHAVWLQILPLLAASLWGLWYFWVNRERWDWMDHGSLLLLVSVMVAPYAWYTDETVVLPAILALLYRASNYGRSLLPFAFVAGAAIIELVAGVHTTSGFYVWTAPAWLALWFWAASISPQSDTTPPPHDGETIAMVKA